MGAYDIETYKNDEGYHQPYCICYKWKNTEKFFYYAKNENLILLSINSIFTEKLLKSQNNIFYIHNLNFDGILILGAISSSNLYFSTFMRGLDIYSIIIKKNEYTIEFRCSYKLLPSSLKNISNGFNLPLKMPFPYKFASISNLFYKGHIPSPVFFNSITDYNRLISENGEIFDFREYSIRYCMRDVEITLDFIKLINNLLTYFNIPMYTVMSAPSLSLKIFLKKFNNNKIKIKHNKALDNYIRPAYKGGHVNVYGNPRNGEFIYHYDFPGMYATVMKEKFPFGEYRFITQNFNLEVPGYYCIDYTSDLEMPVLPHHRSRDGKLMFVNGSLTDIYWNEEILLHIKQGGKVNKIHYAIIFDQYDFIFNDFIDFFQEWRQRGGEYKAFGKLIVNSLYGRLGMSPEEHYTFFIKKNEFEYYNRLYPIKSYRLVNDFFLIEIPISQKFIDKEKIKHRSHKSNLAIAAAITSKARIKLYSSFIEVLKHGGRLLYTDTDSIFAAFDHNVDNQTHGEIFWDVNKKDTKIKDAVFISPKAYALQYWDNSEVIKIKGYNQDSFSFREIKDKFYENNGITLNNYSFLELKNFKLQQKEISKFFSFTIFDKRKFSVDKKTTEPFIFRNWEYF